MGQIATAGAMVAALVSLLLFGPSDFVQAETRACLPTECAVFGGTGDDRIMDAAQLSDLSHVIVGTFQGTSTFGDVSLVSTGGTVDGVVAQIGTDGAVAWTVTLTGAGHNQVSGVASIGNDVVVVGSFEGEVDVVDSSGIAFETVSSATMMSFVARISQAGRVEWVRTYGGHDGRWDSSDAITATSAGAVFVGGHLNGEQNLAWGSDTFTFDGGSNYGSYVTRLDSDGTWVWSKGLNWTKVRDLAATTDNGLYVSGHFNTRIWSSDGDVDYSPPFNGDSGFLLNTSLNGASNWLFPVHGGNYLYLTGRHMQGGSTLAVTNNGTAVFLGQLLPPYPLAYLGASSDAPTVAVNSAERGLAVAVNSAGEYLWHHTISSESSGSVFSGVTTDSNEFVVSAQFRGTHTHLLTPSGWLHPDGAGALALTVAPSTGAPQSLARIAGQFGKLIPIIQADGSFELFGTTESVQDLSSDPDLVLSAPTFGNYDGFVTNLSYWATAEVDDVPPNTTTTTSSSTTSTTTSSSTTSTTTSSSTTSTTTTTVPNSDDESDISLLDPTFGDDGTVIVNVGVGQNAARQILPLNDGSNIVGGWLVQNEQLYIALARIHIDGSLDSTFGDNGNVIFNSATYGVAPYPYLNTIEDLRLINHGDGFLVAASQPTPTGEHIITRLHHDGTVDTSFGSNGHITATDNSGNPLTRAQIDTDSDQRIVVAGSSTQSATAEEIVVQRFSPDGQLDTSFATRTLSNIGSRAWAVDVELGKTGNMFVLSAADCEGAGGYDGAAFWRPKVTKLDSGGATDTSFGSSGSTEIDFCTSNISTKIAISDADEVAVASSEPVLPDDWGSGVRPAVRRLSTNGEIDEIVGADLRNSDVGGHGDDVTWLSDGTIVLVGSQDQILTIGGNDYAVAKSIAWRFDADGTPDRRFGANGRLALPYSGYSRGSAVEVDSNGDTLIIGTASGVGQYSFGIAKLITGPNLTFDGNGHADGEPPATAHGLTHELPGNSGALTRPGYEFNGWNTAQNGSGVSFQQGDTLNIAIDTTIYAQWTVPPEAITSSTTAATVTAPATSAPIQQPSMTLPTLEVIDSLPLVQLVTSPVLNQGEALTISIGGFAPNSRVQAVIASSPQLVGQATTDSTGVATIDVAIPLDLTPGDHTLAIIDENGVGFRQVLQVTAQQLPATGGNSHLLLTVVVLITGAGLLLATRRSTPAS